MVELTATQAQTNVLTVPTSLVGTGGTNGSILTYLYSLQKMCLVGLLKMKHTM